MASAPEGAIRIAVMTASVSRQAGGVFEVLTGLCRALCAFPDLRVHVLGLADGRTAEDTAAWGALPVIAGAVAGPRSFGYSPELARALARVRPDLVHLHGLWMYPSAVTARWSACRGTPCVVSPHGMLDPWALKSSAWKKRIAGVLYERRNLRRAGCLHAVGEAEHDAIRALGLGNPVCLIPNGVAPAPAAPERPPWRDEMPAESAVLLYLGRLHPKKGLEALLRGWHLARGENPRAACWHLVIAGWDQGGHRAALEALARGLGLAGSVHFVGPQFGPAKHAALAAADAFILPSVSEGLPVAVLEAWSHGVPVLMTPQCNLPEGFAAGAALRIDPEENSIAAGLRRLAEMPAERRRAIGEAGARLVADRFAWSVLAARMRSVYRWLARGEPRPDCVRPAGAAGGP